MSGILLRIEEISKNEGITIGALERKIGASKGVLSRAIANGTDIQSKWIQSLVEKYPNYSTEWLLSGNGPMLRDGVLQKEERPADQRAAVSDELLDRIEQQAQEIARLQGKIEAQKDFIELIISKLSKNNGGGGILAFQRLPRKIRQLIAQTHLKTSSIRAKKKRPARFFGLLLVYRSRKYLINRQFQIFPVFHRGGITPSVRAKNRQFRAVFWH